MFAPYYFVALHLSLRALTKRIVSSQHFFISSELPVEYDGRYINGEVIYLIRQAIQKYEKESKSTKNNRF